MTVAVKKKRKNPPRRFSRPTAEPRRLRDDLSIEPMAHRGMLPEAMTRRATLAASTFNPETMTVEATISTFAPVQRRDNRGVYTERLDPAGLDMSRIEGAPVLNGHRQGDARDVIGVVQSARMEGNALVAVLRLSQADDVKPIVDRIRDGIQRGVSMGYRVNAWADSVDPDTKSRVRTAANWTIFEVSAVPVPADPGATFRSNEMLNENEDVLDAPEPTVVETRSEIRTIARSAGMTDVQADLMIDRGLTVTEARAEAFEAMQTRGRNVPRIRVINAGNDDPAVMRTRREDALYARVSGTAPSDEARPFMGETLRDMARACLEAAGISTRGMDADTVFIRAAQHGLSDFPQLVTGVGRRTLLANYQVAGSPLKTMLARQTTLPDFRAASKLKLSDIGLLEKVSESGEIKSTTRGEAAEGYALETYATKFALSRKALINDDLGAFRDWGATSGRMAAETENNLLFTHFRQSSGTGPVMGEDNKRLFHADHGNLAGAGTALDETNLSAARLAMRGVKALDGKTPINAAPKYLLVGPQLETSAEKLLAAIYAATVATANPFSGKLELLVEPRIADKSWYVFADPATLPVLEYAYLSSAQGPQMASREGWDVLGQEFRVVLDFGCGATDFRGAYRNPGV